MTVVEKVCTACGDWGAPSTLTVTVPLTRTVQLGAAANLSTVAATATVPPAAFHNAQPDLRNSTGASAAVTVVHSTLVVAPAATPNSFVAAAADAPGAPGAASATGAFNGSSANSIAMFEGGAGAIAANLGMVLLGAMAVVVL